MAVTGTMLTSWTAATTALRVLCGVLVLTLRFFPPVQKTWMHSDSKRAGLFNAGGVCRCIRRSAACIDVHYFRPQAVVSDPGKSSGRTPQQRHLHQCRQAA